MTHWRWGQQVEICCRDVDEPGGLDLEELRERGSAVSLPTSLVKVACEFPGNLYRSWGPG